MPALETVPVIAIDGPVGSGKGTVSGRVAKELGFFLLDSGALYRALALKARARGVGVDDIGALARLSENLDLVLIAGSDASPVGVLLDGEDVTSEIRTERCGTDASRVSRWPEVRSALLELQRGFRRPPGLVADGRDMGTVVFPDALLKVFLTATVQARAERRHKQLMAKGVDVNVCNLFREVAERDQRDRERAVAPMKPAGDSVPVDTTGVGIEEVVARVLGIYRRRIAASTLER